MARSWSRACRQTKHGVNAREQHSIKRKKLSDCEGDHAKLKGAGRPSFSIKGTRASKDRAEGVAKRQKLR